MKNWVGGFLGTTSSELLLFDWVANKAKRDVGKDPLEVTCKMDENACDRDAIELILMKLFLFDDITMIPTMKVQQKTD